jgi:hypothetical protein
LAPLFSTIIAGVDPLCDTNGHEERTQAAEMQKRRAKIPDPEHVIDSITNLLNEGILSATS